ncbi:Uncharacterised protein [Leclercia adecarboxylata]|uniref:Uncharacterized protein n=1 Tax=Leclercia adecarboxylata TaxID=83655 RepID=A0A4U9IBL3_9ENTR|nr:Uncharacterised protein [Leclercia adecarboxylata]
MGLRDGNGLTHFIKVTKFAVTERVVQQLPFFLAKRCPARPRYAETGTCSAKLPAIPFMALSSPTPKVVKSAAKPFAARVAIGRVGGVQFIGTTNPANIRAGDNVIEKLQIVVAWHTKQMIGTTICKAVQQVIGDGVGGLHDYYPYNVDFTLSIEEA